LEGVAAPSLAELGSSDQGAEGSSCTAGRPSWQQGEGAIRATEIRRSLRILCYATVWSLIIGAPLSATVLEPDRTWARTGKWEVSTARYGVGCVAIQPDRSLPQLSISGEKWNHLSLLLILERRTFASDLDNDVGFLELVLGDKRFSNLEPYGYRGTPGVVFKITEDALKALSLAPTLKITERGALKHSVPLSGTALALKKLRECIGATR
jgi:hypothetical protein